MADPVFQRSVSESQAGLSPSSSLQQTKSLFDYFTICGVRLDNEFLANTLENEAASNPLKVAYKAQVLNRYPDDCPWNSPFDQEGISMMCFPRGIRFRQENEDRRIRFHSFVITKEDGARVYGGCLMFHEKIENDVFISTMKTLLAMYEQQYGLPKPEYATPTRRLTSPNDIVRLYAPKAICLLSQIPALSCMERFLRHLYLLSQQDGLAASVTAHVRMVLSSVPLPPPGCEVTFTCIEPITCSRPAETQFPLIEQSMRRFFVLFRIEVVLQLLVCVLLEKQVIIRSADFELMVLTAECITALLHPFAWPHVYVPILPSALLHFLEAPMPFIMGVHSELEVPSASLPECVVDIDRGTIVVPEDLPRFPSEDVLLRDVAAVMKDMRESSGCTNALATSNPKVLLGLRSGQIMPPSPNNPGTQDDRQFSTRVRQLFLSAIVDLVKTYETYVIIPDQDSGDDADLENFDSMAFLSDQPKAHLPLLTPFVETQIFTNFVDSQIEQRRNNPGQETVFARTLEYFKAKEREKDMITQRQSIKFLFDMAPSSPNSHPDTSSRDRSNNGNAPSTPVLGSRNPSNPSIHASDSTTPVSASTAEPRGGPPETPRPPPVSYLEIPKTVFSSVGDDLNSATSITLVDGSITSEGAFDSSMVHLVVPEIPLLAVGRNDHLLHPIHEHEVQDEPVAQEPLDNVFLPPRTPITPSTPALLESDDLKPPQPEPNADTVSVSSTRHPLMPVGSSDGSNRDLDLGSPSVPHRLSKGDRTRSLPTTPLNRVAQKDEVVTVRSDDARTARTIDSMEIRDDLLKSGVSICGQRGFEMTYDRTLVVLPPLPPHPWMTSPEKRSSRSRRTGERGGRTLPPARHVTISDGKSQEKFRTALLNECATKIKKIIFVIMGGMDHWHTPSEQSSFENTSVVNLCDLLERMWRHGLRVPEGKSALWLFLIRASKLETISQQIVGDIKYIQGLGFLRSDIGRARAWVRLAVEKKTLSRHLEIMTERETFMADIFKSYAFLMYEEIREQVISHLLTLNTVDFACFSSNYPPAPITYRITIITAKGFRSGTSANTSIQICGDHGKSNIIVRNKGPCFAGGGVDEFEIECNNLGLVQKVILAHDNSGLSPAWVPQSVVIRNQVTLKSYEVLCNKRMAKDTCPAKDLLQDGGSHCVMELSLLPSGATTPPPLSSKTNSSSSLNTLPEIVSVDEKIQEQHDILCERFATSINALVKFYHNSDFRPDVSPLSQAYLLLGSGRLHIADLRALRTTQPAPFPENAIGLVEVMYDLFNFGFKSKNLFGANRHLWDVFVKLNQYLGGGRYLDSDPESVLLRCVERAQAVKASKQAKFEWLIMAGATRHLLHVWIPQIMGLEAVQQWYDHTTMFRMKDKIVYFSEMLRYLVEFSFCVEEHLVYLEPEDKSQVGKWRLRTPGSSSNLLSPSLANASPMLGQRPPQTPSSQQLFSRNVSLPSTTASSSPNPSPNSPRILTRRMSEQLLTTPPILATPEMPKLRRLSENPLSSPNMPQTPADVGVPSFESQVNVVPKLRRLSDHALNIPQPLPSLLEDMSDPSGNNVLTSGPKLKLLSALSPSTQSPSSTPIGAPEKDSVPLNDRTSPGIPLSPGAQPRRLLSKDVATLVSPPPSATSSSPTNVLTLSPEPSLTTPSMPSNPASLSTDLSGSPRLFRRAGSSPVLTRRPVSMGSPKTVPRSQEGGISADLSHAATNSTNSSNNNNTREVVNSHSASKIPRPLEAKRSKEHLVSKNEDSDL